MTAREFITHDNTKFAATIIWALVATIILFIKEVSIPRMADGRTYSQAIALHDQRLERIERVVEKLTDKDKTAVLVEGQNGLQRTVERIEQKLDDHIASGK